MSEDDDVVVDTRTAHMEDPYRRATREWVEELMAPKPCVKCKRTISGAQAAAGICAPCAIDPTEELRARAEEREVRLARENRFLRSVPEVWRWAARCTADSFEVECTATAPTIDARSRANVLALPLSCPMLLIGGLSGAGKTTLAVARGRLHVDAGDDVLFVSALELGEAYCTRKLGVACDLLERANRFAGVVIADDIGKELKLGPVAAAATYALIDTRHRHARRTIVTTGLRTADIARDYQDAGMLRRLTEKTRAAVVWIGPRD